LAVESGIVGVKEEEERTINWYVRIWKKMPMVMMLTSVCHYLADLRSIREIRLGQNTKAFEIHGKKPEIEERAFTLIYAAAGGTYKMLNLGESGRS
jgi:hypothetical protein